MIIIIIATDNKQSLSINMTSKYNDSDFCLNWLDKHKTRE